MVRPMRSGTNRPGPSHSRATGPTPRPAAERDFRASRSDPVTLRCGAHAAMDYAQSMRPVAVAVAIALVGASAGAAEHGKMPHRPVPLHFTCADALEDGTLIDGGQAAGLTKVARMLAWPDLGPPPPLPPRDVRLFCGPDIDGDGERDAIVRLAFDNPDASQSTIDAEQLTYTWLASKLAGPWRALGPLTAEMTGERDLEQTVEFMRRPTAGRRAPRPGVWVLSVLQQAPSVRKGGRR